jgi:hypothetical protein
MIWNFRNIVDPGQWMLLYRLKKFQKPQRPIPARSAVAGDSPQPCLVFLERIDLP